MNTPRNPNINPEDPKWTAYVLGELEGPELAEVERLLETSDEARALVEELTLATGLLKDELTPQEKLFMSPGQRTAIREAAKPATPRWFGGFSPKWAMGLGAAAVLAAAVWVGVRPAPGPESIDRVAVALPAESQNLETQTGPKPEEALSAQTAAPRTETPSSSPGIPAEPPISVEEFAGRAQDTSAISNNESPAAAAEAKIVQPTRVARQAANELKDDSVVTQARTDDAAKKEQFAPSVGQVSSAPGVRDLPLVGNNVINLTKVLPESGAAAQGIGRDRGSTGIPAGQASTVQDGISATNINPDLVGPLPPSRRTEAVAAAAPPPPPPPPPPSPPNPVFGFNNFSRPAPGAEAYDRIVDNRFIRTRDQNLATFSVDVDTASYANVRRFLNQNQLPPRDAVRIEELINYFDYDYAQPSGKTPIAAHMEVAAAPWNPQNRLVRIGIKAREIQANRRPPSNLVFLIDVSGSMNTPQKLPLLKAGLKMLVNRLGENDTVSVVVYAGSSGLVLPPTSGMRKEVIHQAIDGLQPGGSTNGASGIRLAYNQAAVNFIRGGVNRVILMTDGDFNVGITNQGELTRLIENKARSGVFLSVLGFGMGNIKDSTLEKLADQGNGHYAYIDNINEARKVLVEEIGSTLVTVAKDVKLQVDFNPARVEAYRLIGYENRALRTEDFNNDAKDAGDMGAGHTVTALFEVVPTGGTVPGPSVDPSKYTQAPADDAPRIAGSSSDEMLTLRLRYKLPDEDTSTRMDVPLVDRGESFTRASQDFRFASAVAEFGMILRDSPYKGTSRLESVLDIAEGSLGRDRNGYRQEFLSLVRKAHALER